MKQRLPIAVLLTNSQGARAGVELEEAYSVLLAAKLKDVVKINRTSVGG